MNYRLSKSEWKKIGLKMGWMRTAQENKYESEFKKRERQRELEEQGWSPTRKLFELIRKESSRLNGPRTEAMLEICAKVDCADAQEMMGYLQKHNEEAISSAYDMMVSKFDAWNYSAAHGGTSDVEYYADAVRKYVRSAETYAKCAEELSKRCPSVQIPPMKTGKDIDTRQAEEEAHKRSRGGN